MFQGPVHRWSVQIAWAPLGSEMLFLHSSKQTGMQVLDSRFWPLSPDVRTEKGWLHEIYAGVNHFMELRS
jgi:hypothetical protein